MEVECVVAGPVPICVLMSETDEAGSCIADRIAVRLSTYVGPHTARVAVKTFAMKALGRGPQTLTPDDLPALEAALRPMLRTFVGRAHAEVVLRQISEECGA
jgi:hypothetical protein